MSEADAIAEELAELAARVAEVGARIRSLEGISAEPQADGASPRLLSAADVAKRLSLPKSRVYTLAREGGIGGVVRIGSQVRFEVGALEAWIRAGGANGDASPDEHEAGRVSGSGSSGLSRCEPRTTRRTTSSGTP